MTDSPISDSIYKQKVRVRACGLLEVDSKLLLLRHDTIGPRGFLWSPPGGGVEFGVSAEKTLEKEFLEETNLRVKVDEFLFVNEYLSEHNHAVELFFSVSYESGTLKLGHDPEVPENEQILTEANFFSYNQLAAMDLDTIHNCFTFLDHPKNIFGLRGFFQFGHI